MMFRNQAGVSPFSVKPTYIIINVSYTINIKQFLKIINIVMFTFIIIRCNI